MATGYLIVAFDILLLLMRMLEVVSGTVISHAYIYPSAFLLPYLLVVGIGLFAASTYYYIKHVRKAGGRYLAFYCISNSIMFAILLWIRVYYYQ